MKIINIDTAVKPLSEYANEIDKEILILESKNIPVAAIVSLKNENLESLALSANPDFMDIIQNSRNELKKGNKISFEEMEDAIKEM